jgi:hypothetical protein
MENKMRLFIGHRLPLGFYGGISVPFRPSLAFSGGSPTHVFAAVIGAILGVALAFYVLLGH